MPGALKQLGDHRLKTSDLRETEGQITKNYQSSEHVTAMKLIEKIRSSEMFLTLILKLI